MKTHVIGSGVLTWAKDERVSDRYGTVWLMPEGCSSATADPDGSTVEQIVCELSGVFGQLVAVVTATRKSTHIGDLFRGIFPRTPKVGDEITLGKGTLFTEPCPGRSGLMVGLKPRSSRRHDWLAPRALYDAHEQSVRLEFRCAAGRRRAA